MELDDLKTLLPAQLKELAHRFDLPQGYVAQNASPVEEAITLLTYAKSRDELPRLETLFIQLQQETPTNGSTHVYSSIPNQPYFFGREAELASITDALHPESRGWGILIDGPGGIGKTWLAIRAGHVTTHFQRKVFLSAKVRHLTPHGEEKTEDFMLRNFIALISDLAKELGDGGIVRLAENERANEVKRALSTQTTLIIVDNLETFDKAEQNRLYQFLNRLPERCKAIVTSRRRSDIDARIVRLDRLDADSALQLLTELAHNNRALARTDAAERQTLYEITQGNPLLLRWTAGQLGRGHCRTVAKACEFLSNAPPDNDPLEYIFGDLLDSFSDTETACLAALSLFTQPAKVQWIVDVADIAEVQAQTALEDLADRALLISDAAEEVFSLPPLAAVFLKRKRPDSVARAGERLSDTVYAWVLENGYSKHERFPKLEAEWPSIAAALPLFVAGDNRRLQNLCSALIFFMDFSGRWDELLDLFQQAESKAEASGDFDNAGWCAYQAGMTYSFRGQAAAVLACAERAAAYWQQAKAGARERAIAIRLRGIGHKLEKHWSQAIAAYQEALELDRARSPESEDVAIALNDLANAEKASSDDPAAERDYREALRIAKKINHREGVATYTGNLAGLMFKQDNWREAERLACEALDLAEALGQQELIAEDCRTLAASLAKQKRAAEGLPYAQRAVEICTRLRIDPEKLKKAQAALAACEAG